MYLLSGQYQQEMINQFWGREKYEDIWEVF